MKTTNRWAQAAAVAVSALLPACATDASKSNGSAAQTRAAVAKARFDEHCRRAGEKIYKTVEGVEHGQNGTLTDFFDPGQLARQVIEALAESPAQVQVRRNAARSDAGNYALQHGLNAYLHLLGISAWPSTPAADPGRPASLNRGAP